MASRDTKEACGIPLGTTQRYVKEVPQAQIEQEYS